MKKYELTDDTMHLIDKILYRVKAVRAFGYVDEGDLGGYVESEMNLSHDGLAWIKDDAQVYENATVSEDAFVSENAIITGNARIYGAAQIYGTARISDCVQIYDQARVYDNAHVQSNVHICETASVYDNALIQDEAQICGDATVCNNSIIGADAYITGNVKIKSNAHIGSGAMIVRDSDYMTISGLGSKNGDTTIYKTDRGELKIINEWFQGTIEEFLTAVKKTYANNHYAHEYSAMVKLVEIHFDKKRPVPVAPDTSQSS